MRYRSVSIGLVSVVALCVAAWGGEPAPAERARAEAGAGAVTDASEAAREGAAADRVVRRARPSARARSVTGTIGRTGGRLELGDVVLEVPAGALRADVEITMTIPRGPNAEVRFEPHGLRFERPARLSVDLASLDREGPAGIGPAVDEVAADAADESSDPGLRLLYVEGSPGEEGFGVRDVLDVLVADGRASAELRHFSGYCFATG